MHVRAKNVTKVFSPSMLGQGMAVLSEVLGRKVKMGPDMVHAVNDVSFEIREGERIGIIGANGAGKSTLLHMLAGLSAPSEGEVDVDGKVTCIMDLGVGIREDLSGRENIYVEAEAQGLSRAEIEQYVDSIISFAELGAFIDNPVRTYSSGMKARLAFSMISAIEPEILIVDEALSAGDAAFAIRASQRVRELTAKGGITIIVSHSMAAIREMCDRVIWIKDGCLVADGNPAEVTDKYLKWVRQRDNENMQRVFGKRAQSKDIRKGASIKAEYLDIGGNAGAVLETGSPIDVCVSVHVNKKLDQPDLHLWVERTDGLIMIDSWASKDGLVMAPIDGEETYLVPLGDVRLGSGIYYISVELVDRDAPQNDNVLANSHTVLKIENPFIAYGNPLLLPQATWSVCETDKESS